MRSDSPQSQTRNYEVLDLGLRVPGGSRVTDLFWGLVEDLPEPATCDFAGPAPYWWLRNPNIAT